MENQNTAIKRLTKEYKTYQKNLERQIAEEEERRSSRGDG